MGYFGNPKILIRNSHLLISFASEIIKVDYEDYFGNSHSVARGRFCHEKSKQMFKTYTDKNFRLHTLGFSVFGLST